MTYTVMMDFFIDDDELKTDKEVEEIVKLIFDYASCYATNVKVIEAND